MRACVRLYPGQTLKFRRVVDNMAFMVLHVSKIQFVSQESLTAHGVRMEHLLHREVRAVAIGDRVLGFSLQEVVEHVYVVGSVRQRLDLHKSERGGTTCLRDQRRGGKIAMVVPWKLCDVVESRSVGKQWHCGGFMLC